LDVCFICSICERPARIRAGVATDWQCPGCENRQHIEAATAALPCCVLCGNHELYKKKDFPHWLGMTILVVACVSSVYTYLWYEKWLTWAILIGSAIIDGGLYLLVGDAVVCYRCDAHYKGFTATGEHKPFELTVGERYRQEKIRREQVQPRAENRSDGAGPA
jgi:uncharacterized protein (DUF983 family)